MRALYNISIWCYLIVIYIAALFHPLAKLWVEGRRDIYPKIKEKLQKSKNIVWIHCASLGEFEQGRPIIEAYKSKHKNHQLLLTFFSPSGFKIKKNTSLVNWVFYLPIDTKANVKKFVTLVKPIKVLFIKSEFWFNYMHEIKKQKIPFYSISTSFRDQQYFFRYKWFAKQLQNVSHFFVQDKRSAQLLKSININNYTISGDTRFDRVIKNVEQRVDIPLIKRFSSKKPTIICGSTWPKDEKILIKYIKENTGKHYIIAPHELNNIDNLRIQTNALLYSKANNNNILTSNVLIIDNIGLLSNIYQYGDLAYIGGGFDSGIHNILEPVAFGLPVIFGPNFNKSNEAIALIMKKGAISISNYKELNSAINIVKNFKKSIALDYIEENSGATKKILPYII